MIRIELEATEAEVGSVFTGTMVWSDLPKTPRELTVELRYTTSGRGDTDEDVVDTVSFPARPTGTEKFELHLPAAGPITYSGNLIHIEWSVRAFADVALARDPDVRTTVWVRPSGWSGAPAGYEPHTIDRPATDAVILPPLDHDDPRA